MDFFVDPDRLRTSGRAMEHAGADAAVELGRLHQGIASRAVAQRADSGPFEAAYLELTAVTGEVLDLLSAALRHGGAGLRAMADTYQDVDHTVGESFGELAEGLRTSP